MLRYCTFSSRYTTTWCYATARSLQVIQLRDATFTSSSFALAHSCHATLRSLGAVGGVLASSFFDLKIFTQGVVFYMHLMLNSTHMSLEHGFITGFSGKYVHHALRKYLYWGMFCFFLAQVPSSARGRSVSILGSIEVRYGKNVFWNKKEGE